MVEVIIGKCLIFLDAGRNSELESEIQLYSQIYKRKKDTFPTQDWFKITDKLSRTLLKNQKNQLAFLLIEISETAWSNLDDKFKTNDEVILQFRSIRMNKFSLQLRQAILNSNISKQLELLSKIMGLRTQLENFIAKKPMQEAYEIYSRNLINEAVADLNLYDSKLKLGLLVNAQDTLDLAIKVYTYDLTADTHRTSFE